MVNKTRKKWGIYKRHFLYVDPTQTNSRVAITKIFTRFRWEIHGISEHDLLRKTLLEKYVNEFLRKHEECQEWTYIWSKKANEKLYYLSIAFEINCDKGEFSGLYFNIITIYNSYVNHCRIICKKNAVWNEMSQMVISFVHRERYIIPQANEFFNIYPHYIVR